MNKYLESIQSMDAVGTGIQGQIDPDSTVVLEVSSEPPATTYVKPTDFDENITQEFVSYLDDLFAEQITLKFATYLSRVAIP